MLKKIERQRPHLIIQDLSNPTDREVCDCKGNIQCRAKNEPYSSELNRTVKETNSTVLKSNRTLQKNETCSSKDEHDRAKRVK